MKTLVINLKSAPERKRFQRYQLKKLGIDFEFMNAETADNAAKNRPEKYWRTGVRLLKDTEKACFLSHRNCWGKVIRAAEPMLILEDDALLSIKTPSLLAKIENNTEIDILNLETRGRRILIKKNSEWAPELFRLFLNRDGAAAYILWPSGAQKMIEKTDKEIGIADAALWTNFNLKAYQASPALALQSDRCDIYDISTPFETKSSISIIKNNHEQTQINSLEYLRFRFKRYREQMRLAKSQIINYFGTEKKPLEIDKADFSYLSEYKS